MGRPNSIVARDQTNRFRRYEDATAFEMNNTREKNNSRSEQGISFRVLQPTAIKFAIHFIITYGVVCV